MVAVLSVMLLEVPVAASEQAAVDYLEKKQHAQELYRQNKMADAIPVLEELAAANDKDAEVFAALGFALYSMTLASGNTQEREQLATRARAALNRAKQLGDKNELTDLTLSRLQGGAPPPSKFSRNAEADLSMQQAEADFVKGELAQAIDLYKKALSLDPKLYEAALYIGDSYYKSPGGMSQAPEWYAKAIAIDPNRETAYRYWADVLMKQGDRDGARDKYVEAYISEPFDKLALTGFTTWAKNQHVTLAHPAITIPGGFERKQNGDTNITIDSSTLDKKNSGASAWIIYGITRTTWSNEKFLKTYPKEKTYRHSLGEEADALRTVMSGIDAKTRKSPDLDPSLAILLKLEQQGELEAYILLARSDDGIRQDYLPYLREHRDLLRNYVVDWVLRGGHAR
jgi:tetratricopeptide (TPR) repeat protein